MEAVSRDASVGARASSRDRSRAPRLLCGERRRCRARRENGTPRSKRFSLVASGNAISFCGRGRDVDEDKEEEGEGEEGRVRSAAAAECVCGSHYTLARWDFHRCRGRRGRQRERRGTGGPPRRSGRGPRATVEDAASRSRHPGTCSQPALDPLSTTCAMEAAGRGIVCEEGDYLCGGSPAKVWGPIDRGRLTRPGPEAMSPRSAP